MEPYNGRGQGYRTLAWLVIIARSPGQGLLAHCSGKDLHCRDVSQQRIPGARGSVSRRRRRKQRTTKARLGACEWEAHGRGRLCQEVLAVKRTKPGLSPDRSQGIAASRSVFGRHQSKNCEENKRKTENARAKGRAGVRRLRECGKARKERYGRIRQLIGEVRFESVAVLSGLASWRSWQGKGRRII